MKVKKLIILVFGLLLELILHWWISSFLPVVENYGISLSISLPSLFLFHLIFVLVITGWYWKSNQFILVLVLIGGMANLIDRLIFGYVRDYWNLGGVLVNNLNDWLIGIGVLLFLIENIYERRKNNF